MLSLCGECKFCTFVSHGCDGEDDDDIATGNHGAVVMFVMAMLMAVIMMVLVTLVIMLPLIT